MYESTTPTTKGILLVSCVTIRFFPKTLEIPLKDSVPVVTTVMGRGAVPTTADLYVGSSGLHGKYAANLAVSECDVLFSIGTRFNDRITGDLNEFAPKAKIVHIDIDTSSISRNVVEIGRAHV